jgi:hypothetical protein
MGLVPHTCRRISMNFAIDLIVVSLQKNYSDDFLMLALFLPLSRFPEVSA